MDKAPFVVRCLPDGRPYIELNTRSSTPIYLTPLYTTDMKSMTAVLSHPEVNRRLENVPYPYTDAESGSWVHPQKDGITIRKLKVTQIKIQTSPSEANSSMRELSDIPAIRAHSPTSSGLYVGNIGLRVLSAENGSYVMGYGLHPDYQGHGIMSAAVEATLWFYSTKREEQEPIVKSVKIEVVDDNPGSRRVVEKVKFEGGFVYQDEKVQSWPEVKGGGTKVLRSWRWEAGSS